MVIDKNAKSGANQTLNKDAPPRRTFYARSHKKCAAAARLLMYRYAV